MLSLLNKLPKYAWIAIIVAIACFVTPVGIGVSALLFKSSTLSYERGDTKINIGEAKNNSQFARKQWENKLEEFEEELEKTYIPNNLRRKFEEELKPTAEAAIEYQEDFEEEFEELEEEFGDEFNSVSGNSPTSR